MSYWNNTSLIDLENEIWKDVIGYENIYQGSSLGRIKSLPRIILRKNGETQNIKARILRQNFNMWGYLLIGLKINKISTTTAVHRVIAKLFIPNPLNLPEVNHINGIKTDNRVENLEWVTPKQNMQHASKNNLLNNCYGERHFNTKFKELDIINIRNLHNVENMTCTEIASLYNTAICTIARIIRKETWRHII